MRRFLVGLAIFTGGVIGLFGIALLEQLLTNQVLGPGHGVSDWEPLIQVFLMIPVVLPPLLVASVLLPRGRPAEVGLFLLGWGFIWPAIIAYLVVGTMAARLFGVADPWLGLNSGPAAVFSYLFFIVLPLAGTWFLTAGLRQRWSDRSVRHT